MAKNRAFFFHYDIPKVNGVDACTNPSDALWERGCARITQSCWAVMESNLPRVYRLFHTLTRFNVIWYALPIDISAVEDGSLRSMLLDGARREIRAQRESIQITIDAAETRFADESDSDYRARRRALLSAARQIERTMRERLRRILTGTGAFGIDEDDLSSDSELQGIELIAINMRSRAQAFAEAHDIVSRMGSDGQAMAKGMVRGHVPPQAVSDYLRDFGNDDAADGLNASFGGIGE